MNLQQLKTTLEAIASLTESPAKPIRGPYDANPVITLVDQNSPGYDSIKEPLLMSAVRPLVGSAVQGANPDCYYPVGLVIADLSDEDLVRENIELDAQFIALLDTEAYRQICEAEINPKHSALYASFGERKKLSTIEQLAKKHFHRAPVQTVLERLDLVLNPKAEAEIDPLPEIDLQSREPFRGFAR